jgi:hypothetical protein
LFVEGVIVVVPKGASAKMMAVVLPPPAVQPMVLTPIGVDGNTVVLATNIPPRVYKLVEPAVTVGVALVFCMYAKTPELSTVVVRLTVPLPPTAGVAPEAETPAVWSAPLKELTCKYTLFPPEPVLFNRTVCDPIGGLNKPKALAT